MAAVTKSVDAAVRPGDGPGEFEMILSDDSLDRDGERLWADQWRDPLPESIPLKAGHSRNVADIVGSGQPYINDDGSLRVQGVFAGTKLAQTVRQLVREGHLQSVSVEFLRHADGTAELVGGAFVDIPSNPVCRVVAAKALPSSGGSFTMTSIAEGQRQELEAEFAAKVFRGELTEEQANDYEKRWEQLDVRVKNERRARQFAGPPTTSYPSGVAGRPLAVRDKRGGPTLILDDVQVKSLYDKAALRESAAVRCKDLTFNDTVEGQLPAQLAPWVSAWIHERRIMDRLPTTACTAPSYEIIRHVSTTGSASIVSEGQQKPEIQLNLDHITLPMLKLAAHSAESWETISDYDRFTTYLQHEMPLRLVDAENSQLLYGLGAASGEIEGFAHTPGILTWDAGYATDTVALDAVEESIEYMRTSQALAEPDVFIISPSSWSALRRIKNDLHRYILSPDPTREEANQLWGVPVLVTTQCNPGDGFLIDTNKFGKVIVREGITVRQGLAEDDFIRNLLRWVFEERLNLGVERPTAVLMLSNLPTTVTPGS